MHASPRAGPALSLARCRLALAATSSVVLLLVSISAYRAGLVSLAVASQRPVAFSTGSMAAHASWPVDLAWHAPSQTLLNNLTHVVGNGTTGVYGFIYNSSYTPDEQYGTYNWCNMPHVRASEYARPDEEFELVYVELMHRHHKRTPYAANSFPTEPYRWDCDDEGLYYLARPFSNASSSTPSAGRNSSGLTYWQGTSNVGAFENPFQALAAGWKGSCQFPQITAAGLDDSWQHGADLYGVYGDLLGFLPARDDPRWRDRVRYRVTNNVITSEVASMLVHGMWRTTASVPLLVQPAGVDSLEPSYACAAADALLDDIKSPDDDDDNDNSSSTTAASWAAHLRAAQPLYATLDRISGVDPADDAFHASLDHYYDNLSARQCHGKPLPCRASSSSSSSSACITQAAADAVYRLGHWEYSRVYRDAGAAALAASAASLGVWVGELAAHLRGAALLPGDEAPPLLWLHNVAHDGSVSRLLGVLQADVMVWPGMGSEVVFELWRRRGHNSTTTTGGGGGSGHYVRVLFGGQVLRSSNPSLGSMDMLPVETLLAYFDGLVGVNASLVVAKCSSMDD